MSFEFPLTEALYAGFLQPRNYVYFNFLHNHNKANTTTPETY